MRVRNLMFVVVAMLIPAVFVGCNASNQEVTDYVENVLPTIAEYEQKIIDAFDRVTGANYQNDEIMCEVFSEEVMPACDEFIAEAQKIQPKTKELAQAHTIYIDAYTLKKQTCEKAVQNYESTGDADDGTIARLFADVDELLNEYVDRIEQLMSKN